MKTNVSQDVSLAVVANKGQTWRRLLEDLVHSNAFLAAVLTDFQGLPFLSALHPDAETGSEDRLIETLAAFAPPMLRTAGQMESFFGRFSVDEITTRTKEGALIVSRVVERPDIVAILTVLVPPRRAYRRAMNKIITQLQKS